MRIAAPACILVLALAEPGYCQTDDEVAARLTPSVQTCEQAPENAGTFPQALCYKDELTRQDQQLNATWTQVTNRLAAARMEKLRRGERQWIKERDATCEREATEYVNATKAYMYNVCMTNETIRRIMWLEKVGASTRGAREPLNPR